MGLRSPSQTASAGQAADAICAVCGTYEIELCVTLADPCDYIGHSFIAIDDMDANGVKTGAKKIVGFYPATAQDWRSIFSEGSGRVISAPGAVQNDSRYYKNSDGLYADRLWALQYPQALAAHRFIQSREEDPGQYSLWTRQCNNFALDVLTRAGIAIAEFIPPSGPVRPSFTYTQLSGRHIPAADFPPSECLPVTRDLH